MILKQPGLTSVVDVVDDVEVVLHRGAVRAGDADAGGEEEQRQSRGQPAARQDAQPDISSSSPRQHAVESGKALRQHTG